MILNYDDVLFYLKNHTNRETADHFNVSTRTIVRWVKKEGLNYEQLKYGDFPNFNVNQNELMLASLLGDAHIDKQGRFRFKQCITKEEYVIWMNYNFEPYSRKIYYETFTRQGKAFKNASFCTINHSIFKKLRQEWYPNGVKIVPKNIILNSKILAHWHVQDGNNNQLKKSIRLATHCFSVKDVKFLIHCLDRDLNIHANLQVKNGKYPIIDIGAYEYQNAINLISNHIDWNCFLYKKDTSKVAVKKNKNSGAYKLNMRKASEIRVLFTNNHINIKDLAKMYNVTIATIYNIINQVTYRDKDFAKISVIYNPRIINKI